MAYYKYIDGVRFEMTEAEVEAHLADLAEFARRKAQENIDTARYERDQRLIASDFIVARSAEAGVPAPSEWVAYRQALRDVPQQPGFPDNIQWPTKPE
jgi:hypothetical protein